MSAPSHARCLNPYRPARRSSRLPAGAALLVLLATFACDDEPTTPPEPEPASVTISPATVQLYAAGDTVQLSAEVKDETGQAITGYAVSWVSADPSVATISASGLVRAENAGMATITATAGSVSATATVRVVMDPDRNVLVALYEATGGPAWANREGWLTDAPISDWDRVVTDSRGRVTGLHLYANNLAGSLPAEIGDLTELAGLWLGRNSLTGLVPAELANLAGLVQLQLDNNEFTGPIPPQLGNLTAATGIYLHDNDLTGEIPTELGNLSRLTDLWLGGNGLTGPFPSALTRLTNLDRLMLADSRLTGALPEGIENMASLTRLILANSGLSGPLPAGITGLDGLTELLAGGTGLCAPANDEFRRWLEGIPKRRIRSCEDPEEASAAYLIQAVQSRRLPVPLVAGEDALLRVFVVAPAAAGDAIPLVRATFYHDGVEAEVVDIDPGSSVIREEVDESSLESSANTRIPASLIRPGLEMVVTIDPEGAFDPALGVAQRIPEAGRMAVDVRAMPDLELTLIPFLWSENPDSAILEITDTLSTDDDLLWPTRELLPVADIRLKIHEPVVTSSNSAFSALDQTGAIRAAEGGAGYYMGTMSGQVTDARGVAVVPGWISFSIPDSSVMTHELGHNLSLFHAPCGGAAAPDPSFPEPDGTIGAWGYDFVTGLLVEPTRFDLMSYCNPEWISGFYFTNSLRHRLDVEGIGIAGAVAAPSRSLLIWGGVDRDGVPYLHPVFVIDAPPALPRESGPYRLVGADIDGAELFALNLAMPEVADGDERGSFAFALPVQPRWAADLARITLSGPGGSVTLDTESERPSAIMRDPRSGQVRAILSTLPPGTRTIGAAARLAPAPGLEVIFSRGIPDPAAWRR